MYETYNITLLDLNLDFIDVDLKHHVSKRPDSHDIHITEPNGMICLISFIATANIRDTSMIISFKSIRFYIYNENKNNC